MHLTGQSVESPPCPLGFIILAVREEGISFKGFRHHYETVHISLMRKMSSDLFTVSHHRRYVLQAGLATSFDRVAEIRHRNANHMQAHATLLQTPENGPTVADNCSKFLHLVKRVDFCGRRGCRNNNVAMSLATLVNVSKSHCTPVI